MNTPKIRFKGFTDAWEQRKFKELCDMVTVGIANSATHAYSDSGVVMFRNQNIKPNFLDDTDIIHINSEFEVKYKNKRLKKNDLLVARTGYPGTACVVPEKYENSQTFTTLIARPNENVNPYFLCQYLNSDIGIKYFESTQIGGGQKNSGAGILNEMPVTLPSTIEEEKQIADYFIQLDNLITLHQRKCDETKQLKKFMLQKMFPKNGEKNPEIRFEGFTDDWEQRKFGDYNDLMTGYPFESDKFSEDGIKLVRGMNVKRGYLDFSGDICVKWNSCVGLENFLLKDGDILIQMDGALIGKSYAKIKENQLPALLVQRVTRARTNNKFASQDFMYQTIQRDFLRYIEMNKTETAVPHLSLNDIRNFEIMVPCLAEQKKIGEYFDSLDNLITLHQRKCEKLKELKKFMLQNMFV